MSSRQAPAAARPGARRAPGISAGLPPERTRVSVQRAFILADEGSGIDVLPVFAKGPAATIVSSDLVFPVGTPLDVAERQLILATLDQHGGDKRKGASALHISVDTLYARLKEYKAS